ncbi:MAG: hypothetical protein ACI379_02795 [Nocardioides sp.]|uniref:hypothetical protein n=1 Tax=Nocardioides sp. TaxID=35761 RepID=UPI003EFE066D
MFNRSQPTTPAAPPAPPVAPTPAPQFTPDPKPEAETLLRGTEAKTATIATPQRDIVITTKRVLLLENSGGWCAIPLSSIGAFEVSEGPDGGAFVKIFFGGGLSRMVGVPTPEDAATLAASVSV